MNVTIIGTGNMARGITGRALAGGHTVKLLGHEQEKADTLSAEFPSGSVTAGTVGDPIDGDVVVLAVPYQAVADIAGQYGSGLDGKVVVDISNPVDWSTFDSLVTPADSSAAEEIARTMSGARVVKAFNTNFAGTLASGAVGGQPLDVLVASDDAEAKQSVQKLVEDGGMRAIDAGPLRRARQLEQTAFLHMLVQEPLGTGFGSALKFVS